MIKNFRYYIFVCAFAVLSACATDHLDEYPADRVTAVFTSGIGNLAVESRAANNAWGSTDEVGIYALAASGSVGTALPGLKGDGTMTIATDGNYRYKAVPVDGSDNKEAKLTPYDAVNTVYYPVDNTPMTFIAYYPYIATASLKTGYKYPVDVTTDQSVAANQAKVDLLYHKNVAVTGYRKEPEVALQFKHQLSKIIIKVAKNETMGDVSLENLSIKLSGMPTTADFALADGTLSNLSTVADIISLKISSTATSYVAEAIIVPHDNTANAFQNRRMAFEISAAGLNHSYDMPDSKAFESGIVYTYNMTLTRTGVEFEGSTISDWGSTSTSGLGDDCVMKVSRSRLYFSNEGFTGYSLIIKTNLDEPTITYLDSDDASTAGTITWISNTQADLNEYDEENGLSVYELLFNVSSGNNTTGYIHITSDKSSGGTYSRVVEVIQSDKDAKSIDQVIEQAKSNCYIINPYGHGIAIPVDRANDHVAGAIGAGDAITAELIWSDAAGSNEKAICSNAAIASIQAYGTGNTGYVIVHPGNIEGNAVVAVKVGGVIKWSWHIWTTSYDPNTAQQYTLNGHVFTDRNLGATNIAGTPEFAWGDIGVKGVLYQWGRKDPFPVATGGADVFHGTTERTIYNASGVRAATTAREGKVDISATVLEPDIFITNTVNNPDYYDWLVVRNDYLWEVQDTWEKTIYDPCPIGWRVPSAPGVRGWVSPWNGLDWLPTATYYFASYGTGRYHDAIGYYPYTGVRSGAASTGTFQSSVAAYWTSSVFVGSDGNIARIVSTTMHIDRSYVSLDINGVMRRSYGCSIRCVKE